MTKRTPRAVGQIKTRIHGNLSPQQVAAIISEECGATPSVFNRKRGKSFVFFTPHGWDCFASAIAFGKWVPENALESQYFLEGYYFVHPSGETTTVITHIIAPSSASQGPNHAQLYSETNNAYQFVEKQEAMLKKYASRGKDNATGHTINPLYDKYGAPIRVGFGHTHPNIGTFISSVDRTSIFAAQGEPWITMVADPRREEILAAVGEDLDKATVIIFHPKAPKMSETTEKAAPEPETHKAESLLEFIHLAEEKLACGCSVKITVKGSLPGKLKFKGEVLRPKQKPKRIQKQRRNRKEGFSDKENKRCPDSTPTT